MLLVISGNVLCVDYILTLTIDKIIHFIPKFLAAFRIKMNVLLKGLKPNWKDSLFLAIAPKVTVTILVTKA